MVTEDPAASGWQTDSTVQYPGKRATHFRLYITDKGKKYERVFVVAAYYLYLPRYGGDRGIRMVLQ